MPYGPRNDLLVCCAYMPQEKESKEAREAAFGALSDAAASHRSTMSDVVIVGDINARLGSPVSTEEASRVGRHGQPGARTANGNLLASLLRVNRLVNAGGTRPPPKGAVPGADFWFTRADKATSTKNTIDFILASESLSSRRHIKFEVDYKHLWTDHHLLVAHIPCPRRLVRKRGGRQPGGTSVSTR